MYRYGHLKSHTHIYSSPGINIEVCSLIYRVQLYVLQYIYTVVQPLYNVLWDRVSSTTLRFTCKVACKTEIIVGCAVTLTSGQTMLFGNSTKVEGNLRAFEPRLVTIDIPNINSDLQYSYSGRALTIGSGAVYPNSVGGLIPPSTRKYVCMRVYA